MKDTLNPCGYLYMRSRGEHVVRVSYTNANEFKPDELLSKPKPQFKTNLVENIGIEPIVTEVGGVTVPCHTIAADSP